MKQSKLSARVAGIILFLVCLVLAIGAFTVLKTCGPMEDGSWMTCHWAGEAVKGVSVVMAVLAAVGLFTKNSGVKVGLSVGIIANAVLNCCIPGTLIHTCMMPDMQCNAVTKPCVMALSVVIIVIALINAIISVKASKEK